MSDIGISFQSVSKTYRLYHTPGDRVREALLPFSAPRHVNFSALQDLDFAIGEGEAVGILGANGSGKSTTLQLMSGILEPTSGTVDVKGRLAALLELGAGFNLEFTGRENVNMQGLILGFSRSETARRMPEIERFAEIGDFFDRPMRLYSSGMFMRVAFAAAIHADPDLLLIDEALTVGDVRFQAKCFSRLSELREARKTVILVSHDTHTLSRFCTRGIVLDCGRKIFDGTIRQAIFEYDRLMFGGNGNRTSGGGEETTAETAIVTAPAGFSETDTGVDAFFASAGLARSFEHRKGYVPDHLNMGNGKGKLLDCLIECDGVNEPAMIETGAQLKAHFKFQVNEEIPRATLGYAVQTLEGVVVFGTSLERQRKNVFPLAAGSIFSGTVSISLDLTPGKYVFCIGLNECPEGGFEFVDTHRGIYVIEVTGSDDSSGLVRLSSSVDLRANGGA
jgi:lipopolysaccharide transport system ATP-binding protein